MHAGGRAGRVQYRVLTASAGKLAHTVAHEVGHQIGAPHDCCMSTYTCVVNQQMACPGSDVEPFLYEGEYEHFDFDVNDPDAECTPDTSGGMAGPDTVGNFMMCGNLDFILGWST